MIAKVDSMGTVDEPSRDFKKNRNLSTNSTGTPPLSNISSYGPQGLNSGTLPPLPAQLNISNPNMLQPTNNKINGQPYPEPPKSPKFLRIGDDHRLAMEGVKLAM